jgi:hypothetical protein
MPPLSLVEPVCARKLNIAEREHILLGMGAEQSIRQIAKELGRHPPSRSSTTTATATVVAGPGGARLQTGFNQLCPVVLDTPAAATACFNIAPLARPRWAYTRQPWSCRMYPMTLGAQPD